MPAWKLTGPDPEDDQGKPWKLTGPDEGPSLVDSLVAGAKQLIPEIKSQAAAERGMPLDQAVQKARGDLSQAVGLNEALPGTTQQPWQARELGAQPIVQAAGDIASGQTWKDIKQSIAEKPLEAGITALSLATPLGPEAGAAKATEALPSLLSRSELKGDAIAGIEGAKQSGLSFAPEAIKPVLSDIRSELDKMGFDAPTHKKVAIALGHMDRLLAKSTTTPEAEKQISSFMAGAAPQDIPKLRAKLRLAMMDQGTGHTFKDIHNAQINLRSAMSDPGTQGAMGSMMQGKLDDYVFGLPKGPEFQKGIADYSQARKLDEINAIKERVLTLVSRNKNRSGYAHTLAQEIDKIAKDPKKMRLWTPDEQKYITNITRKGNLAQKIAGAVGVFAPTGIGRVGLDAVVGHVLGAFIPGGTYGLMAIGATGRAIEKNLAKKQLGKFENVIAAGGSEADLKDFRSLVSPRVSDRLEKNPVTRQAMIAWSKAKGPAKRTAARTLAVAIARHANTPSLVPRIEMELNGLGGQDETKALETGY